jgi:beta-glucosidase/6-phospho-beta-glucosidase/beta-galactosidase
MRLVTLVAPAVLAATALFSPVVSVESKGARCFPDKFMFGSATAAYQVEGAGKEGGRTPSIWDDFCRKQPGLVCANVADDFYHRYKDDVKLMVETGLQSFRFSVAWSRVMGWDNTTKHMKVYPEGVAFYHALIDELSANKIEPILTLYHFDLPLALETEQSPPGWLNADTSDHFVEYSDLVFHEYGNKVSLWTTFNEPSMHIGYCYSTDMIAPGHTGSDTEAYVAAKNLLVAHAKSVARFRELKKEKVVAEKARIGIVLVSPYYYPLDEKNPKDVEAAERGMMFDMGWFLMPIVTGDYPAVMHERVGDRLPKFSEEESMLLKGSYDLFMLNHYGSNAVTDCDSPNSKTPCDTLLPGWLMDKGIDTAHLMPGTMQGKVDSHGNDHCTLFTGYPPGYLDYMKWVHAKDPSADILLTENGWCGDDEIENMDQLHYFQAFVEQVHIAIHDEKLPVIGYTAWSFLDNYEWGSYTPRFGLYYVNFTEQTGSPDYYEPKPTDLTRIPRPSAKWFKKVATTRCLDNASELASTSPAGASTMSYVGYGVGGIAAVGVVVATAVLFQRRRGYTSIPQQ